MSVWGDFLSKSFGFSDFEEEEVQKRRMALELVLWSTVLGLIYSIFFTLLGYPSGAYVAMGYVVFSLVNIYFYFLTKLYGFFKGSQLVLLLALPFLSQVIMGGYVNSGGNAMAGVLAAVGALIFSGVRQGRIIFFLFVLGIIGVSIYEFTIIDEPYQTSREISISILSITIIFTFSIIYFVVESFIMKLDFSQKQLKLEKEKTESLILNILPPSIAAELKESGFAKAQGYASATVVMCDIIEFSTLAKQVTPQQLVEELDIYFRAFDDIIEKHNLEKIKTIGDAYMYAGGLPVESRHHARDAVNSAIELQRKVREIRATGDITYPFGLRVGISSGPLVAGVVGKKKFAYDIWGETVNLAARMEQNGEADKINISDSTYLLVSNDFNFTPRGKISVKHAGDLEMYFVDYEE